MTNRKSRGSLELNDTNSIVCTSFSQMQVHLAGQLDCEASHLAAPPRKFCSLNTLVIYPQATSAERSSLQ